MVHRFSVSVFAVLCITASSTACSLPSPESRPGRSVPFMPEATATPAAGVPPKTGGAAISFHQSGGFAGIVEEWNLYSDGRIASGEGEELWVSPKEVA